MISRRSPASSSFVLAAARLRALQLDPWPRGGKTGQLRGRIQKNSQPSPAARVVTGPDPYALLTVVALMGADVSNSAVTGLSYKDPALQDPCSRFTNGDLLGLTWHCAKSTYLILCCPDNFWVANLLEFLKNIILLGRGK
jgi:hypothetical protein